MTILMSAIIDSLDDDMKPIMKNKDNDMNPVIPVMFRAVLMLTMISSCFIDQIEIIIIIR